MTELFKVLDNIKKKKFEEEKMLKKIISLFLVICLSANVAFAFESVCRNRRREQIKNLRFSLFTNSFNFNGRFFITMTVFQKLNMILQNLR
jgi:hypothetical protein